MSTNLWFNKGMKEFNTMEAKIEFRNRMIAEAALTFMRTKLRMMEFQENTIKVYLDMQRNYLMDSLWWEEDFQRALKDVINADRNEVVQCVLIAMGLDDFLVSAQVCTDREWDEDTQ